MATIHRTTLVPSKIELVTAWLPDQPWYDGAAGRPRLERAGGFRLDDPAGKVGIEFAFLTDASTAATYHVPLSYRGAPLDGGDQALIGTAEHGVLGRRWVYDATRDPVAVAQLLALLQGEAQAQAQSVSDTPDLSIGTRPARAGRLSPSGTAEVTSTDRLTRVTVPVVEAAEPVVVDVVRVLGAAAEAPGWVAADWQRPDGSAARGRVILAR